MANKSLKEGNKAMIDMKKMKIGDKFRAPTYPRVWETKLEEGTIVYIHPERRSFTVEFITETGVRIRESYHPAGPLGCTRAQKMRAAGFVLLLFSYRSRIIPK